MRKNEKGQWVIKDGFFLRHFWRINLWIFFTTKVMNLSRLSEKDLKKLKKGTEQEKKKALELKMKRDNPEHPKNICAWFWGWVIAPLMTCLILGSAAVVGLTIICLIIMAHIIALVYFLFGFVPINKWNKKTSKEYDDYRMELEAKEKGIKKEDITDPLYLYHPYKKFGKKDEKKMLFAPWQILLPLFTIWLIFTNSFAFPRGIGRGISALLFQFSVPVWAIFAGIVIATVIIFAKKGVWKMVWDFLKDQKEKRCSSIIVEPKKSKTSDETVTAKTTSTKETSVKPKKTDKKPDSDKNKK